MHHWKILFGFLRNNNQLLANYLVCILGSKSDFGQWPKQVTTIHFGCHQVAKIQNIAF